MGSKLQGRHFLSMLDFSSEETHTVLDTAAALKAGKTPFGPHPLKDKTLAMIFQKPSLRTRVSFEAGMTKLGGHAIYLAPTDISLGKRETTEDIAMVLARYADVIMARVFGHDIVVELAKYSRVPVINGLSDFEHPCQCLADLLTVREAKGDLAGLTLTYLGDGNNVTHSLLLGGTKAGMHVRAGTPPGFEPIPQVMHRAAEIAASTGGSATVMPDPVEASRDADVLYTDVWASMGQEAEADERALVFPAYALDLGKVQVAKPDAIVMHCLPAHRGQEIADDVIDGPRSVVWDQAENRMHTQKALLLRLLGLA